MPVVESALIAKGAVKGFALAKKAKLGAKAQKALKVGFRWVKGALGTVQSIKKGENGYTVTSKDGQTYTSKGVFGGPKEATSESNELMKYAPYIIGGLILLTMKK